MIIFFNEEAVLFMMEASSPAVRHSFLQRMVDAVRKMLGKISEAISKITNMIRDKKISDTLEQNPELAKTKIKTKNYDKSIEEGLRTVNEIDKAKDVEEAKKILKRYNSKRNKILAVAGVVTVATAAVVVTRTVQKHKSHVKILESNLNHTKELLNDEQVKNANLIKAYSQDKEHHEQQLRQKDEQFRNRSKEYYDLEDKYKELVKERNEKKKEVADLQRRMKESFQAASAKDREEINSLKQEKKDLENIINNLNSELDEKDRVSHQDKMRVKAYEKQLKRVNDTYKNMLAKQKDYERADLNNRIMAQEYNKLADKYDALSSEYQKYKDDTIDKGKKTHSTMVTNFRKNQESLLTKYKSVTAELTKTQKELAETKSNLAEAKSKMKSMSDTNSAKRKERVNKYRQSIGMAPREESKKLEVKDKIEKAIVQTQAMNIVTEDIRASEKEMVQVLNRLKGIEAQETRMREITHKLKKTGNKTAYKKYGDFARNQSYSLIGASSDTIRQLPVNRRHDIRNLTDNKKK